MLELQIIKSRTMKRILYYCILVLAIQGCYYDIEEELYPTLDCNTTSLAYTEHILPIIESNCYSCHDMANNFGNVTLEGHSNLLQYVNNNQLLGVIRHDSGFSPMPKNAPQLLECEIQKIEQWIADGAPNN
jgi:hypothetical protein